MSLRKQSRREFVRKSGLIGLASPLLSTNFLGNTRNSIKETNELSMDIKVSESTKRLKDLLEIEYPIIQAPAGGVITSDLVAAVSGAGAFGGIPLSWSDSKATIAKIEDIKSKTGRPFYGNFVLSFEPKSLDTALQNGIGTIQFSWGQPDAEMIKMIRNAKANMGIQVTSEASAQSAIDLGADFLVCQGTEAGGHVHASRPLEDALVRVLSMAGNTPVVASGGIADGVAMRKYMDLGAAGVVMGSRFVATKESGAHDKYKNNLLKAKSEDTVFTVAMNKGWNGATHRILRSKSFEMWEAAGCPMAGKRPGEKDIIANIGEGYEVERYSINAPHTGYEGEISELANYAGKGVDDINDLPHASDLVKRIWEEYMKG
jgi:nitronate monooxygenase